MENSDFGSTSGTHSESSRRSWKLRFLFLARFRHARPDSVGIISPQFPFVKQIFLSQAVPSKTHKSYRSSRTGYCTVRDKKCGETLVDLYNILEYQKDRPNGCTQKQLEYQKDRPNRCTQKQLSLSLHYGRGCKIRISRRTPNFQGSTLLVHPSAYALVGGSKKPEAIWLSLGQVIVWIKSRL